MSLIVQKYGGTSVGSLEHIKNVAHHIVNTVKAGKKLIVTISAMGEQTDELLAMAMQLSPKPPRREVDMLLTAGERISMALLSIALHERGVPSVSLTGSQCGILTDETHGNARITRILGDRIRAGLERDLVVIVAGFQGVSPRTKEVTTLGRGGSDLSAIALAASLGASGCQLYKDVHGVYTADPRTVAKARVLTEVSWRTMTELAWAGASVLHARGAHLAAKFNIPFEIRSSFDLDNPGTLIRGQRDVESVKIAAIAHKRELSLLELKIVNPTNAPAFIAASLDWLWQHGESPQVTMQASDGNGNLIVTQLIKTALVSDYLTAMNAVAELADGTCKVTRRADQLASITVVGEGFKQSPESIRRICASLNAAPLLFEMRNTAVTIAVPDAELDNTLNELHQELLEKSEE